MAIRGSVGFGPPQTVGAYLDVMRHPINHGARISSDPDRANAFLRVFSDATLKERKKVIKALQNHPGDTGLDAFVISATPDGNTKMFDDAGYVPKSTRK